MDINLMVIAVGNSRLHVGAFLAGELKQVRRLSRASHHDWPGQLAEVWSEFAGVSGAEVAGCCVVPGLLEQVEAVVKSATGQAVLWVGNEIELPIKVLTKEPEKTGVDRVLVTAAAYEQLGKACVVVDAGTAMTVNLCNDKGELVGGAIAPGVGMMLGAMHEKTGQLPAIAFSAPTSDWGTDTVESMRHGVTHALRGLVQTMAERWAEASGTWPEVIATGGDAAALFEGWEIVHAVSPDLLLYGIALAYAEHHIKHGS